MKTTVIVDTREKAEWTFEGDSEIVTKRATLKTGDYSVEGLEHRIAIERKSLEDWISTVIHNRSRFYRELNRLLAFDFRCVIIECGIRELFTDRNAKRVSPESVMGFVAEVAVKQCVPVYLAGSRAEAQTLAGAFLKMAKKKLPQGETPD